MALNQNYEELLQHLRHRRDEIDGAIQVIQKVLAQGDLAPLPAPVKGEIVVVSKVPKAPAEALEPKVKPGMFTGMQVWKAASKYLQMAKRPQTTRQVAAALLQGGLGSNAKKFDANLHQALSLKPAVFTKVDIGTWGLKEWEA